MNEIAKKLEVKNKCDQYSNIENKIRKEIMNFIIDNKRAFNIEDDIEALKEIQDLDLLNHINNLIKENGIVVDENKNVIFAYPVSAVATNHHVKLNDGREFYAMCAIDAMGCAFTFHQDVLVKSKCSNTSEDVYVKITNGEISEYYPKTLHALHVDLNKHTDWGTTC